METGTLIKWLENIVHKFKYRTYVEERSFISTLGNKIELPSVTKQKYNSDEIMDMHTMKADIVIELHRRGIIDEKGYAEYMLSQDLTFIPEFILTIDK